MSIKQGEPGYHMLFNAVAKQDKSLEYGTELTDEQLHDIGFVRISLPVDKKDLEALKQCPNINDIFFDAGETLNSKGKKVTKRIEESQIDDLVESMNLVAKYVHPLYALIYINQKNQPLSKQTYEKLGQSLHKLNAEKYEVSVRYDAPSGAKTYVVESSFDKKGIRIKGDNAQDQMIPAGTVDNVVFFGGEIEKLIFSTCDLTITSLPPKLKDISLNLCRVDTSHIESSNLTDLNIDASTDLATDKSVDILDIVQNQNICNIDHVCVNYDHWYKQTSTLKLDNVTDFSKIKTVMPSVKSLSIVCDSETNFEQIAKIFPNLENLELSAKKPNAVSLDGIENLKNLKSFVCSEKRCMLKNIDKLYDLENITQIDLSHQQLIRSFDVSKVAHLEKLNLSCSTIEEIKGLDKIEPTPKTLFDLSKCFDLKDTQGLDEFLQKATQNQKILDYVIKVDDVFYQNYMDQTVDGEKIHEQTERALLDEWQTKHNRSCISINTEFAHNSFERDRGNPIQMSAQRKYIDHIIKTQCGIKPNDDDWTKAKKLYDWTTQNLHYASGMLSFEDNKSNFQPQFFGEKGYNHYYLASPYFALLKRHDINTAEKLDKPTKQDKERGWGPEAEKITHQSSMADENGNKIILEERTEQIAPKHYAVCEGIANLYVQMLQQVGIEAYESGIDWYDSLGAAHAITKAKIDGEFYFFDPTWDLGRDKYEHFGNTKEQAEQRHTRPSSSRNITGQSKVPPSWRYDEDKFYKGGKDVQDYLESRGLLSRGQPEQEEVDTFNQAMLTKELADSPKYSKKYSGLLKKVNKIFGKMKVYSTDIISKLGQHAFERVENTEKSVGEFCNKIQPCLQKLGQNKQMKQHWIEDDYNDYLYEKIRIEQKRDKIEQWEQENTRKLELEQAKFEKDITHKVELKTTNSKTAAIKTKSSDLKM